MSIDDGWDQHIPTEEITSIYVSKQDMEILRRAADIKLQSVQDFVFLAAWDAANKTLRETE